MARERPVLAITMGDPAGVGPEVIAKALDHSEVWGFCRPVVVGDARWMEKDFKSILVAVLFACTVRTTGRIADEVDALLTALCDEASVAREDLAFVGATGAGKTVCVKTLLASLLWVYFSTALMFDMLYGGLIESIMGREYMFQVPLWFAEGLAEHDHAEEHADERVDVVAEARVEDAVVTDRPEEDQPVGGDRQ